MKMTKRLLSMLLAVAMVVSLMPSIVLAADTATQNIVEVNSISSLTSAFANAKNGDVIRLTSNIGVSENWNNTASGVVSLSANATLDLNGYILRSCVCTGSNVITVNAGYTLTVTDSSANGTGEYQGRVCSGVAGGHLIGNKGTVIVEGGTIRHIITETNGSVTASALTGHLIMAYSGSTTTISSK